MTVEKECIVDIPIIYATTVRHVHKAAAIGLRFLVHITTLLRHKQKNLNVKRCTVLDILLVNYFLQCHMD